MKFKSLFLIFSLLIINQANAQRPPAFNFGCPNVNFCNQICNEGFSVSNAGCTVPGATNVPIVVGSGGSCVFPGWRGLAGTPDYIVGSTGLNPSMGVRVRNATQTANGTFPTESICTGVQVQAGQNYLMSYRARRTGNIDIDVSIRLSNFNNLSQNIQSTQSIQSRLNSAGSINPTTVVLGANQIVTNNPNNTPNTNNIVTTTGFTRFVTSFQANANYDLLSTGGNHLATSSATVYSFFDDFVLIEDNFSAGPDRVVDCETNGTWLGGEFCDLEETEYEWFIVNSDGSTTSLAPPSNDPAIYVSGLKRTTTYRLVRYLPNNSTSSQDFDDVVVELDPVAAFFPHIDYDNPTILGPEEGVSITSTDEGFTYVLGNVNTSNGTKAPCIYKLNKCGVLMYKDFPSILSNNEVGKKIIFHQGSEFLYVLTERGRIYRFREINNNLIPFPFGAAPFIEDNGNGYDYISDFDVDGSNGNLYTYTRIAVPGYSASIATRNVGKITRFSTNPYNIQREVFIRGNPVPFAGQVGNSFIAYLTDGQLHSTQSNNFAGNRVYLVLETTWVNNIEREDNGNVTPINIGANQYNVVALGRNNLNVQNTLGTPLNKFLTSPFTSLPSYSFTRNPNNRDFYLAQLNLGSFKVERYNANFAFQSVIPNIVFQGNSHVKLKYSQYENQLFTYRNRTSNGSKLIEIKKYNGNLGQSTGWNGTATTSNPSPISNITYNVTNMKANDLVADIDGNAVFTGFLQGDAMFNSYTYASGPPCTVAPCYAGNLGLHQDLLVARATSWNGNPMIGKGTNNSDEITFDEILEEKKKGKNHEIISNGIKMFPNPMMSNNSTLTYTVTEASHVNITLLNTLGEVIRVLKSEDVPTGDYQLSIERNDLPSGIYFCNVRIGAFGKTLKLIIN